MSPRSGGAFPFYFCSFRGIPDPSTTFMSSLRQVWSDWQPLVLPDPLSPAVLAEVVDGGQTFRWNRLAEGVWQGVWAGCVARLKPAGSDGLLWSAPQELAGIVADGLPAYFGTTLCFDRLVDGLPWRSDEHLARCLKAFPGLRLLRQPLEETLLCFLCSATKQIVQIKQMVELLAKRHGREIVPGIHRLPTWAELATVSEEALRSCQLGFRARYVSQTAQILAGKAGWLEQLEHLPCANCPAWGRRSPIACCSSAPAGLKRFRWMCGSPRRWSCAMNWTAGRRSRSPISAGCISAPAPAWPSNTCSRGNGHRAAVEPPWLLLRSLW
jgi:hypothetical protein